MLAFFGESRFFYVLCLETLGPCFPSFSESLFDFFFYIWTLMVCVHCVQRSVESDVCLWEPIHMFLKALGGQEFFYPSPGSHAWVLCVLGTVFLCLWGTVLVNVPLGSRYLYSVGLGGIVMLYLLSLGGTISIHCFGEPYLYNILWVNLFLCYLS